MQYYIKQLYSFLDSLKKNNNREWFEAHRADYEQLRKLWLDDLDRLIGFMSEFDPRLATLTARSCAYRIYRDTRFSNDKTPSKTFFSASITPGGRKSPYAGYYIEIGNPTSYDQGLYGGLWCPEPRMLAKIRHAIVDNIEEWEEIINNPTLQRAFPDWCCSTLKTAPKGWPKDHPQIEFLRMTNYGRVRPCTREFYLDPAWPERAAELFQALSPFINFLNYTIDE